MKKSLFVIALAAFLGCSSGPPREVVQEVKRKLNIYLQTHGYQHMKFFEGDFFDREGKKYKGWIKLEGGRTLSKDKFTQIIVIENDKEWHYEAIVNMDKNLVEKLKYAPPDLARRIEKDKPQLPKSQLYETQRKEIEFEPEQKRIDKETVYDLFHKEIKEIEIVEGSFTKKGALEALVCFYDPFQCRAEGWKELWLLKFEDGWRKDRKIIDHEGISFRPIDIDRNNKSEIWISTWGGGQGYIVSEDKLLSLNRDFSVILYSNMGFDHTGAGKEEFCLYEINFSDIDNDRILEIIELKEEMDERGFRSKKSIYKLVGNKFEIL